MRKSLVSLGVLALATVAMGQESYTTNWSGHRTLHVNTLANSRTATTISANVIKYPMLVRLGQADSAIFAAAKTDGADVRFTKSNNTTRLQHSIETWDATNRIGAVWVLLDTVYSNNQTQNFRMHWGNVGAVDSSKSTAVFDTANGFVAVWHMNGATNALTDVTVNAFTGTAVGNANTNNPQITSVTGMIGRGHDFPASTNNDGTGGSYRINGTKTGALNFPDSGVYTLSAWALPQSTNQFRTVIGKGDNAWAMHINSGTWEYFQYASIPPGGAWQGVNLSGSASSNNWYNIVGIRNGPSSYLYLNGMLVDSTYTNATNGAIRVDTAEVHIGKWGGAAGTAPTSNDRFFDGILDEIRVSKVVRSANWAALDFGSQNAAQTLLTDSVAPVIAYGVDSIVTEVGTTIASQLPIIFTGVPQPSVTILPALPAGLAITTGNTNRGLISGTPTAAQAKTMHVITATNGKGTFSDTIYVTVNAASTENYTTWANMRTMSFNSPATATVTQYPFLVRLGASDSAVFSGAGTNGASLRFSRTDAIKLKYSIEHWDATARKAAIWVLMDQVTSGANTLRMHWGNGTATSQSNSQAVFARSNGHVGVWHMGNASGAAARPNSVQPGVNDAVPGGTATATMLPIAGVIGMADTLRAQLGTSAARPTDDHFSLGTGIRFANYQMSMSMWINLPVAIPTGWNHWMGFGNSNNGDNVWMGRVGSNDNWKARGAANGGESNSDGALVVTNGLNPRPAWAHFAVTRSGNLGRRWTMHKNGVQLIDFTGLANNHDLLTTVRDSNFIGRALWGDPNTRGTVDEARVDNVARSAAWYQLDYETQRPGASPVANLTYGTISGTPGSAMTPRAPSHSGTATGYSYTGTLPAGIVFNDTTGVISGTPTGPGGSTITVTANSGVWSASTNVSLNFGAADGAYGSAWSGHEYISINAGNNPVAVYDSLRNFPILVRLGTADAAIFAASQKSGGDIRFTKIGDVIRLKHEIDHWDSAARSAAIWVKVDTVYGKTNGSRVRMHWGNATVADSSQPNAVFDSANGYVGVWHMGGNGPTQGRANSVVGGNPAVPTGSTANLASGWTTRTGLIGLADSLRNQSNGTSATNRNEDDYLNLGTGKYANFTTGLTISMWAKPIEQANYTGWTQYISFSNGQANNNIWMGRQGGTMNLSAEVYDGTTSWGHIHGSEVQTYGVWQHLSYTVTATGNQMVFRDGAMAAEQAGGGVIPNIERTQNHIGRSPWGDRNFLGGMDEVRLSKVARSPSWVKLEYHNQSPTGVAVVRTGSTLVPITVTTGVNQANIAGSEVLSFKKLSEGILFQVRTDVASKARLSIVDMHGRTVWSHTANTTSGMNQIQWNGASSKGAAIGSGIYVVRMSLLDANGKATHRLSKKIPLTR